MKTTKWKAPEYLKYKHIPARMWREEDMWLVEIPDMYTVTQGYSKNDAYRMAIDVVRCFASIYVSESDGFNREELRNFKAKIVQFKSGNLIIGSNNPIMMMLVVQKRKDEMKSHEANHKKESS